MRSSSFRALLFSAFLASFLAAPSTHAGDDKSPTSGFLADYLAQIQPVQSQIMKLEQAVPQEKYTWRPAEGVRSISEVYLHIAGSNYFLLSFGGYTSPKEVNYSGESKQWEGATTDKQEIAKKLQVSFDWLRATVTKITDADLEKKVNFFGNEITLRSLLIDNLNHLHEHLGQSIAYARMNGVVPPWTAEAEAKAKEKAK
jgi:uncharacterized damage-inducible protein DinB